MLLRLSVCLLVFLTLSLSLPRPSLAQVDWKTQDARCVGKGPNDDVATIQGLECLFFNVLQVITQLVGFVFFAMFIVGGFQYLTSSGDQKAMGQASTTLTNALIGAIGVIASFLILQLLSKFTGINSLTIFKIPGG